MSFRDRSIPIVLAFALALLTVSWLVTNPPSAAPDETAHYIKALGAGGGDLAGEEPRAADSAALIKRNRERAIRHGDSAGTAYRSAEWARRTSRSFKVPAGRLSSAFDCSDRQPQMSWACLESGRPSPHTARELQTYIGTYLPFAYIHSGLLARQGSDPETSLRLGRAGMAALSLLLLIAAIFLLWERRTRGLSLIGLMAAVTPMAVFLFSTLSASGPEIAGALCFTAAVFRATRDEAAPRWAWPTLAVSGIVLAVSRQLGPLFVALVVLGVVFLIGWRGARGLFAGPGRLAAWSAVAIACATSLVWDSIYQPHPSTRLHAILEVIPSSVKQLGAIVRQEVGIFGWLDSPLPLPAYLAWLVMLGALLLFAVRTLPAPLPKRLCVVALGVGACTVVISALHRQTGFTLQGRYVLPMFILVPLAAGELIHRHASPLGATASSRLVAGVAATAASVHAIAWIANGRRVAVGVDGSWLYALNPEWSPPLGWLAWAGVVALACAAYLGTSLVALRLDVRCAPVAVGDEAFVSSAAPATVPYR